MTSEVGGRSTRTRASQRDRQRLMDGEYAVHSVMCTFMEDEQAIARRRRRSQGLGVQGQSGSQSMRGRDHTDSARRIEGDGRSYQQVFEASFSRDSWRPRIAMERAQEWQVEARQGPERCVPLQLLTAEACQWRAVAAWRQTRRSGAELSDGSSSCTPWLQPRLETSRHGTERHGRKDERGSPAAPRTRDTLSQTPSDSHSRSVLQMNFMHNIHHSLPARNLASFFRLFLSLSLPEGNI